ncbi:hypothetical protein FC72_GL001032 [Companilactobacillus tucceti DSM 20183]|uniref:Uncharacterized protein n=1 Tax=Companilactobacillus tucceti DSM 20183 TaxID=1423811 RepID=A0A0R1IXB7_9LACO|nr:hypothetical protein [Companilactobacillus tucceti]KRK63901.1 hypothetical protein FC72_GL001032 [Companilactobacillus tucceti DSM 20183]
MGVTDDFPDNLKKLQDLKFLIYESSKNRIDFHDFGILTMELQDQSIKLDEEFKKLKNDHTIEEIAQSIVQKYNL